MILGTGGQGRCVASVIKPLNITFVLFALLCLCVSSWADCQTGNWSFSQGFQRVCVCSSAAPSCPSTHFDAYTYRYNYYSGGGDYELKTCNVYGANESCPDGMIYTALYECLYSVRCTSQAEADSVAASLGRNACTDYKDDCESRGGVWNGEVVDDSLCSSTCNLCGTPESQAMREYIYNSCCEGGLTPQYSCGFPGGPSSISGMVYSDVLSMGCNTSNWETQKICDAFYNESSSSESSSSSSVQSSSSVSEYCLIFPNDLACICAADSTNPDCDYLRSSSSQAEPGSSGGGGDTSSDSGGGGTPSESSASGGVAGDNDWEYDYRDSLHRIINTTSRTAINSDSIMLNTSAIKKILQNAKCLFSDCTDYEYLGVIIDSSLAKLDTNIEIPDGDTLGILDSMRGLSNLDSLDLFLGNSTELLQSYEDSIPNALNSMGAGVDVAFDSISEGMEGFREIVEDNFPTSRWSYTGACPTALTNEISFTLPLVGSVNSGKSLGNYFCAALPVINVNLGSVIRAVLRLILTITMAYGIFRTATGFKDNE